MTSDIVEHIKQKAKNLTSQDVVWYVFIIIMLAMTWSGAKAIQTNYGLEKQISRLQQENDVLSLQNNNISLQNQYFESDQYLDLAARESLGLAAPGEKVLLIPTSVALKYVTPMPNSSTSSNSEQTKLPPKYIQNIEAWRDFLLGRQIISN